MFDHLCWGQSLVLDGLLLIESSLCPFQIQADADLVPFGSTDPAETTATTDLELEIFM